MSDRAASYIRTMWPLFLGHIAALVVTSMASRFGIEIDSALAFEAVGFVASALVYWLGRKMENSAIPFIRGLGKFVLSLGLDVPQPTYVPPPPVAPASRAAPLPPPRGPRYS